MNDFTYVVITVLVLALVVFGDRIRRRARRAGADIGERAGKKYADSKLPGALAGIGTTLVLETTPGAAAQVVDAAAATKPKRFRTQGDGVWHAKFVESDDVHVRLVPAGSGTQLQVESFRDYLKFPQGLREWEDLRERVTKAAAEANVPVRDGAVVTYERRDQIDEGNWRWHLAHA